MTHEIHLHTCSPKSESCLSYNEDLLLAGAVSPAGGEMTIARERELIKERDFLPERQKSKTLNIDRDSWDNGGKLDFSLAFSKDVGEEMCEREKERERKE